MNVMENMDVGQDPAPMMDMSMPMYFHASAHAMILFKGWMTHDWQKLLGSCVAIFLVAMLYEGFKVGRELLQQKMAPRMSAVKNEAFPVTTLNKDEGGPESYGSANSTRPLAPPKPTIIQRIFNASHIIQAFLHIVQVWLSMCLMLVFMTYNVWLCLAVSLGAGFGYFVFAWLRDEPGKQTNEHCT